MRLISTQGKAPEVSFREALFNGLAPDNGLYIPKSIPTLPEDFFTALPSMSLADIGLAVTSALLNDEIASSDLQSIVESALSFDAPVTPLNDHLSVLELFHGPTLAFKDFGARFMAQTMAYFLQQDEQELTILVATSGDTGSAVAQGFLDAPGISVVILYPSGGVSHVQEQQLTTVGSNVRALEVLGSFDDCQRMVKAAFMDTELRKEVALSSANSINIARLIPQSFYYFYAVAQIPENSLPIVFSVPSGNFGNLTAGLLAKKMGLPVKKFIAATNINDVVPEYLASGVFTARPSVPTLSNAMDVGNPSNLVRMQALYGGDLSALRADIEGYSFTDTETVAAVKAVYDSYGYLLDPHGAVAYAGLEASCSQSGEKYCGIILETAHPAKFGDALSETLGLSPEIPERLATCLNREKQSTRIEPELAALKKFLLELQH